MMMPLMLAAAAATQMTFICSSSNVVSDPSPYVLSFEQEGSSLRNIWVIWPDGSQSADNWKVQSNDGGFVLKAEKGWKMRVLTLTTDKQNPKLAKLDSYFAITGGHVPMDLSDNADCSVRIVSSSKDAK